MTSTASRTHPSPFTGWVREDWERLFATLSVAFAGRSDRPGSPARPDLPGCSPAREVCGLEGFARMSVAWGAWLGQTSNPAVVVARDREVDILGLVVRGLLDGTDANSPWFWGPIRDRDQRIVEAAELATGLWLGRDRIVPALGPSGLTRVLDWLERVDGRALYPDNWVLFPALTASVRRGLGRAVPDAAIDTGIDEMLAWYVGDGWYRDGDGNAFDQYTGWAIHWHLLLWSRIDGDRRPRIRALVERRARTYLRSIVPLFAADGSRPLQGRSLGYRFAAAAPFALGALLGLDAVPPGLARRIASGTIARHLADGAIDPTTGWFVRGVGGERPDVCERYMSAGASAWSAHALVALGLPGNAPFWTADEAPLPVEQGDGVEVMRGAGFLAGRRAQTGETWILSAKAGHPDDIPGHDYAPFYGKLAYRSHFPITVRAADGRPAPDDAVLLQGVGAGTHRGMTDAGAAGTAWTWSRYGIRVDDRQHGVTTVVLPWRDVEVRVTGVRPGGPVRLSEGTAALGTDAPGDIHREAATAEGWAMASSGRRSVAIRRLLGYDEIRASGPWGSEPDRNLVADHSEQPVALERAPSTRPRVVATAIASVGAGSPPLDQLCAVRVNLVGPQRVEVELEDEVALACVAARGLGRADVAGLDVEGPGIRVVRASHDHSRVGGESIRAIRGVIRLDRPGVIDVWRREPDLVEIIAGTGFRLDAGWAGFTPTVLDARTDEGWRSLGALEDGVVPASLVRRLRRLTGRQLVSMRVRP